MIFDGYIKAITTALKRGDATEHTHRPALKALIESFANGITATNEPKRIACGAPDYIVTKGIVPVGYVEAKDVNVGLDDVESDEQLKRYRGSLRNLILTDYLEFRYFRNGVPTLTARLGKWQKNGVFKKDADGEKAVADIFRTFLEAEVESVGSPRELAQKMAQLARMIHDLIGKAFGDEGERGDLHSQYEGFKQVLIADLTPTQFADMYAQTIAYGLFAARCNHDRAAGAFTRDAAARDLPKTNPFLRKIFQEIAGHNLDERIAWAVDDLVLLLDRADMSAILQDFGKATRQEDPVVHFYETFLAAYDQKLRETRGVYYTPEPVVSYIVRSVDAILKRDFGLKAGLADSSKVKIKVGAGEKDKKTGKEKTIEREVHRVQILDPATGTGTFLHAVIAQIRESFSGNSGMWPGYVAEHLLPRIYGFELLIAPYAVAHMKLGLQLKESGYDFVSEERLRVYLTNTLEEAHELNGLPLFAQAIAHEAASASEVKKDAPIMVVIGNPPYSGHSANKGKWIQALMDVYKQSPELKKPAQAKWLNDDYVKFIRFSQWRIEQTGYGILAFVTNHSYLDNPTFMDMRRSLMQSFDSIYLFDLHGSSKKKEKALDGSKDENVFDIQQGVAICLLVKRSEKTGKLATVKHAELYGMRQTKYDWLYAHDIDNTKWTTVMACEPSCLFVDRNERLFEEYLSLHHLPLIMNQNGDPAPGIVTTHDEFAISWDQVEAVRKVEQFLKTETESEARELFTLCSQSQWDYKRAKSELKNDVWKKEVSPILYRPFDIRHTVYNSNVAVHRRDRAMQHMRNERSLALLTNRQVVGSFDHAFCATQIINDCTLSTATKERTYLFPLWLYPRGDLIDDATTERRPNFSPEFLAEVKTKVGCPTPEQIFYYLYAILYSRGYRTRYAEFLKRDFPRVPLTADKTLFTVLGKLGERLVALHLMKADTDEISRFPIAGSNEVVKVEFKTDTQAELSDSAADSKPADKPPSRPFLGSGEGVHADGAGRVYINAAQYFDDVPVSVWNYHIGGYQVCQKWLKDRKGRQLSYDDIKHYHGIVAALSETIELQVKIDEAIPGWPLA